MSKPNLLFIFTDEQRCDTLGAYGNKLISTPNIDRLAQSGTLFERAYVTQPVCTPSRSSLMTGQYPHDNGCTDNNFPLRPQTRCLPELLGPGWATGYHGKWHLGDEIFAQHGFDDWVSIEDDYRKYYGPMRDRNTRSSYHHFLMQQGVQPENGTAFKRMEAARFPESLSKPAFLARESARFIRQHRDEPFMLCVNFLEPHMPFFGPRDSQYDPAAVSLPANFRHMPPEDGHPRPYLMHRNFMRHGYSGMDLHDENVWRGLIARYWGLSSLVDTHVGTILDTLEECGLADNTIVVYTSDHGDMMGSHQLITKCVMYEEAVRVPMIVKLPGQQQARRVAGPVGHIDLAPTLLDLMGADVPRSLSGRSLRPLLEGASDQPRDDVVVEWNGHNGRAGTMLDEGEHSDELQAALADPVRTLMTQDGWKFNYSPMGRHELFNLNDDPHELHSLAGDPKRRSLMEDLTQRLRKWQILTVDRIGLARL